MSVKAIIGNWSKRHVWKSDYALSTVSYLYLYVSLVENVIVFLLVAKQPRIHLAKERGLPPGGLYWHYCSYKPKVKQGTFAMLFPQGTQCSSLLIHSETKLHNNFGQASKEVYWFIADWHWRQYVRNAHWHASRVVLHLEELCWQDEIRTEQSLKKTSNLYISQQLFSSYWFPGYYKASYQGLYLWCQTYLNTHKW